MTEEETRSGQADAPSTRSTSSGRRSAASSGEALRKRAEEIARGKGARMPENMEALSPEQARQVLHELQVHQIELEMQNEELRGTQAKLEASRAQYFDLYEMAPVGYFTVSEQGLILDANLTAATLLGVARGALVKRPLSHFVLPEDRDIHYRHRKTLFETGAPQVCEMRLVKEDGAQFWARLEATVAQDADGARVCRAVVSDVTERRRAEAELVKHRDHLEQLVKDRTAKLEAAQADLLRKERLAALGTAITTVNHEIRNPLGSIRNSLFSVGERVRGQDEAVDRALARAERSIKRVDNIIRDVLCHASNTALNLAATDIDSWLASLLDDAPIPEGIRLTKKLSCGVELPIDRERLYRCVVNVIDNACQAMSGNKGNRASLLTVETSVSDGRVNIRVRDTGQGIPAHLLLGKIFEPLHSTKTFGMGLGLSLVKQILEQHAGGVEVESREGEGTLVTLWLPRGEQEAQLEQASHSRC
jgi:PAS domain S-box-containing protein